MRLQIYGVELASGYSNGLFITLNSVITDYSTIVNGVYNGTVQNTAVGSATKINTGLWLEASNPNAALDFTLNNYAQSTNRVICDWILSNTGSVGNPSFTAHGTGVFTVVAAQAITSITIKYDTGTGGNYTAGNYILYGVN